MERITTKHVEGRARMVNGALESRGSDKRVFVQGRNGGTAVDLVSADGRSTLRLLTIGTKSETYRYLCAMTEALWALDA